MLMLTRRLGEAITLQLPSGQQIHIDISQLKGNMVRVGITHPKMWSLRVTNF